MISCSSTKLIKNGISPLPFPLPALLKQYWYTKRGERVKVRGHAPFYATLGFTQAFPTGRHSPWDASHGLRCCYIFDARTRRDAPACVGSGDCLVCRECTWRVVAHGHIPTGAGRMTPHNNTLDRMTRSAVSRVFQCGRPWRAPRHRSALRYVLGSR